MKLCVIPARGGSKRIPRKNIKPFLGKPIIAYSIQSALQSGLFDRVVVSTDDAEIAEVAQAYGAEVPFLRPDELSGDFVGTIPVIQHAAQWHQDQGFDLQSVCAIYATAPFVTVEDLQKAYKVLISNRCDYVFSAAEFESPIQRAFKVNNLGRIEMMYPEYLDARSQDLTTGYFNAGQFYWGRAQAWLAGKRVLVSDSIPYIIPSGRVQDIDNPKDWHLAELMYQYLKDEYESV
jgi:N-acylneuraminate cytidylyltransferase